MPVDIIGAVNTSTKKQLENVELEYIEGSGNILPNCQVRAKKVYSLHGLGAIFSGNYYARGVKHIIDGTGYSMTISLTKIDYKGTIDYVEPMPESTPKPAIIPAPISPNGNYKFYVVEPGDTLWAIAIDNSSTVDELASLNEILNPDVIYAGKELLIPIRGA